MFETAGDGSVPAGQAVNPALFVADGEIFEIRYVDAAEAETWASARGVVFGPHDIAPAVLDHFH